MDADDVIVTNIGFDPTDFRRKLCSDLCHVQLAQHSTRYWRPQIFSNKVEFKYRGVLHEYVAIPDGAQSDSVDSFYIISNREGSRSSNPRKYEDDAILLQKALETENDPFLIARYTFYMAQSWRDAGQPERALAAYLKRAELGYWEEEVYVCHLEAARQMERLQYPDQQILDTYMDAHQKCPARAEALHGACRYCRIKGFNSRGYEIGKLGLNLQPPGGLFEESWIYEYGLRDEFAVNAYWSGHYDECLQACLDVLKNDALPATDRARALANARFAFERLPKSAADVRLPLPVGWVPPSAPFLTINIARNSVSGLVSVITPTRNRASFLRKAAQFIAHQDYRQFEWLVLDDSETKEDASNLPQLPFLSYEYLPSKHSIGEKRNMLVDRARGEYIVQFDDDDYYAPNYISSMLSSMDSNKFDLMNLRGWFLQDRRSDFFGYWDLEIKKGPHFECNSDAVSIKMLDETNNGEFADNHLGFGFSYVFTKDLWKKIKFPDRDWNEDGEFAVRSSEKFRVGGVYDDTGICLHVIHRGSTSRCFPQYQVPRVLVDRLFDRAITKSDT
jgi:hypothetical protein